MIGISAGAQRSVLNVSGVASMRASCSKARGMLLYTMLHINGYKVIL